MSDAVPSPHAGGAKTSARPTEATSAKDETKKRPTAVPVAAEGTVAKSAREVSAAAATAEDEGTDDEVSSNVDFSSGSKSKQRKEKSATDAEGDAGDATEGEEDDDPSKRVVIDATKDLWSNITLNVKENNQEVTEVSLLAVGGAGSGKTSLLQRIYSADGGGKAGGAGGRKVKPTTALDYSFARRSDRNFSQVAHFWELAQNRQLSSLADIILSPDNIHAVVCTVVVDLFSAEGITSTAGTSGAAVSDAGEAVFNVLSAWDTAVYWLKRVDSRAAEVLEKMKAKNSSTPAKLMSRAQKFCGGGENPDLKRMRLSGLPTVLVVNKMDLFFQHVYNNGAARYNRDGFGLLVRAFRFLAHLYGCHLIFTAAAPESGSGGKAGSSSGAAAPTNNAVHYSEGINKWRNVMSHMLFQTPFESKYVNFDLEKDKGAVLVTAEKDSFLDIGEPNSTASAGRAPRDVDGQLGSSGDAELERWRAALAASFPLPDTVQFASAEKAMQGKAGGEFTQLLYDTYAEPAVDALRRQKDEELEQYRKTARLRAKEAK